MKKFAVGHIVSWPWGKGTATGKVTKVSARKVKMTIKGAAIVRNGTADDPALTIAQVDGDKVLKLSSEVTAV